MAQPTTAMQLNSQTPAAPSGNQNVKFQSDGQTPMQSVSAYVPAATTGTLGSVRPDGTTITISDTGVISAAAANSDSVSFGSGSPSSAALVQAKTALGTSVAFPSNVTSGHLLIVSINNAISAITLSDTLGTSYAKLYQVNDGSSGIDFAVYAGLAPSSGPNTVSFTASGDSYQSIGVMEVAGATATVDVQASFDTGSANPSSQTPSVSLTTTEVGDFLYFAVGGAHNGNVFAYCSPFTLDSQINGSDAQAVGHCIAGAAGAYSAEVSISGGTGTDYDQLVLIAFKPSGSTVSAANGDMYFDTATTPYTQYVYSNGGWQLVGSSASSPITLENNGEANGSQTKLNLVAGSNITISDDGEGDITITATATGGGGGGGDSTSVQSGDGPPFPQAVHVQSFANGSASGSFGSNVTAGDLLVIGVHTQTPVTNVTITDSLGTAYTLVTSLVAPGGSHNVTCGIFAGVASASGANTVTASGTSGYTGLCCSEFSGVSATVDASGGNYNESTAGTVSLTTTASFDLLYIFMGIWDSGVTGSGTAATPNTAAYDDNNPCDACAYGTTNTAGTYAASITTNGGADRPVVAAAFKCQTQTQVSSAQNGLYFNVGASPAVGYIYNSGAWVKIA